MAPIYSDDGSMCMISCDDPGVFDISFKRFKFNYVRKIILSSAPLFGIVFLIHGHFSGARRLAMARVGALDSEKFDFYDMSDIVFNKNDNKFYAICTGGRIVVLDLKDYHWGSFKPVEATVLSSVMNRELLKGKIMMFFLLAMIFFKFGEKYEATVLSSVMNRELLKGKIMMFFLLAMIFFKFGEKYKSYYDSSGETSVLLRQKTRSFKIFKFDPGQYDGKDPNSCWIQVKDLGDDAMFLGLSQSTCVTTLDKPWLKRNSVYFVEDMFRHRNFALRDYTCDGGVFSLKENKIERFFPNYSKVNWPLPA